MDENFKLCEQCYEIKERRELRQALKVIEQLGPAALTPAYTNWDCADATMSREVLLGELTKAMKALKGIQSGPKQLEDVPSDPIQLLVVKATGDVLGDQEFWRDAATAADYGRCSFGDGSHQVTIESNCACGYCRGIHVFAIAAVKALLRAKSAAAPNEFEDGPLRITN